MKIILSRKGFDSSYGGIPSPVIRMANGLHKIISLPIPTPKEQSDVQYSELEFLEDYSMDTFINANHSTFSTKFSQYCHLDPDLRYESKKVREEAWTPAFGQDDIAQLVLQRNQVQKGDLFLFFGWFQFAEFVRNDFKFIKSGKYPNGFHMLFGYLEIESSFKVSENCPIDLNYHPHFKFHNTYRERSKRNNTIYKASEYLSELPNLKGANIFNFSEELILTIPLESRRSIWRLPTFFHPNNGIEMGYHHNQNRWSIGNSQTILKTVAKGQEFVISKDPENRILNWAISLIERNSRQF